MFSFLANLILSTASMSVAPPLQDYCAVMGFDGATISISSVQRATMAQTGIITFSTSLRSDPWGFCLDPTSPSGTQHAYCWYRSSVGKSILNKVNLTTSTIIGTAIVPVTPMGTIFTDADITPNGQKIIFTTKSNSAYIYDTVLGTWTAVVGLVNTAGTLEVEVINNNLATILESGTSVAPVPLPSYFTDINLNTAFASFSTTIFPAGVPTTQQFLVGDFEVRSGLASATVLYGGPIGVNLPWNYGFVLYLPGTVSAYTHMYTIPPNLPPLYLPPITAWISHDIDSTFSYFSVASQYITAAPVNVAPSYHFPTPAVINGPDTTTGRFAEDVFWHSSGFYISYQDSSGARGLERINIYSIFQNLPGGGFKGYLNSWILNSNYLFAVDASTPASGLRMTEFDTVTKTFAVGSIIPIFYSGLPLGLDIKPFISY